ncbi:hypothetical protein MRX96_016200 [Rhipicephalus microplus]
MLSRGVASTVDDPPTRLESPRGAADRESRVPGDSGEISLAPRQRHLCNDVVRETLDTTLFAAVMCVPERNSRTSPPPITAVVVVVASRPLEGSD